MYVQRRRALRPRRGTATVTIGDAGCTRALSFVAVSIFQAAELRFSSAISAMAPAGARSFPSWMT
jgi:hypothetical protein